VCYLVGVGGWGSGDFGPGLEFLTPLRRAGGVLTLCFYLRGSTSFMGLGVLTGPCLSGGFLHERFRSVIILWRLFGRVAAGAVRVSE